MKKKKDEALKCPLFEAASHFRGVTATHHETDCLKERCAWFNDDANNCDPMGLLLQSGAIAADKD